MDVALLAERGQQLDLGDRQAGVAEQRQPGRQVPVEVWVDARVRTAGPERRERRGMADVGRVGLDPGEQPAPQLGLPGEVGVERPAGAVGVAALAPVGDQLRPLDGVRREQRRQPEGHAVAAVAPQVCVVAGEAVAEVGGERRAPGLAQARVDGGEHRPDEAVGVPRVVAVAADQQRDQRARLEEPDARAHAVTAAGARPQAVGEPLGQPPLDAPRRHHDDLLGERVVEGLREEVAERLRQQVGARGPMQVERHAATLCVAADGPTRPARHSEADAAPRATPASPYRNWCIARRPSGGRRRSGRG